LGYSSLHAYLEKELGYSSAESALRVANVKLMKIAPTVEKEIKAGHINLTQGGSLFQAISKSEVENKKDKVEEALILIKGKSTRESEKIIHEVFETKSKLQEKMVLSDRLKEKLERLKKIYGEKSFEELIEIIVDEKLMDEKIKTEKEIKSIKSVERPTSRYIPISLKRAIATVVAGANS
jgi:hypothetical protein